MLKIILILVYKSYKLMCYQLKKSNLDFIYYVIEMIPTTLLICQFINIL